MKPSAFRNFLLLLITLNLAACQAPPPSPPASPVGHWSGEYRQHAYPKTYPLSVTVRADGSLTLQDGRFTAQGQWTLNGTTFKADYTFVKQEASYLLEGEYLSSESLRGTWRPAAAIQSEGTFSLDRL